jgi:hypothetical protein
MTALVRRVLAPLGRWLLEQRWGIAAFVAALVVRLHWNLEVHPPADYIYSDMNGYLQRANTIFAEGWSPREYNAFYPYGTHVFLFALQAVFGREAYPAMASVYAVLGAGIVWMSHALACRVSRHRWVPGALALVLVFYYPLISLGGYFLSEIPFSFCLVASTLFLLRVVDRGRRLDALVLGVFVALAFTLRPQVMLSVAFVGLFWLVARRHLPRLTVRHFAIAMIPVLAIMAFSSWRLHHHTGRYGLISENGSFNRVFGRCHNNKIVALPDQPGRSRTSFGPPPFIQLAHRQEVLPDQWPRLDPALELEFEYRGYIGDAEIHRAYIQRCIEATGWRGQVDYALVHVALLVRYNVMWPDSGRPQWRALARAWNGWFHHLFAIPALFALITIARPRSHPRLALVSLHAVAVVVLAVLYFGDVRFRAPYDPIIMLMALEVHAIVLAWLLRGARRLRNRGNNRRVEAVGGPPPGDPS